MASLGGALTITHSTIAIESCDFHENTASFGGAIFSEISSSITINNYDFTDNHAKGISSVYCAGGAVLIIDETCIMIISNTAFFNNTSDLDGGMAAVINAIEHVMIAADTSINNF